MGGKAQEALGQLKVTRKQWHRQIELQEVLPFPVSLPMFSKRLSKSPRFLHPLSFLRSLRHRDMSSCSSEAALCVSVTYLALCQWKPFAQCRLINNRRETVWAVAFRAEGSFFSFFLRSLHSQGISEAEGMLRLHPGAPSFDENRSLGVEGLE